MGDGWRVVGGEMVSPANPQREAYIRKVFAQAAEELIRVDPSRSGSLTLHFQNGGTTIKDEWKFGGRIIVPEMAFNRGGGE